MKAQAPSAFDDTFMKAPHAKATPTCLPWLPLRLMLFLFPAPTREEWRGLKDRHSLIPVLSLL